MDRSKQANKLPTGEHKRRKKAPVAADDDQHAYENVTIDPANGGGSYIAPDVSVTTANATETRDGVNLYETLDHKADDQKFSSCRQFLGNHRLVIIGLITVFVLSVVTSGIISYVITLSLKGEPPDPVTGPEGPPGVRGLKGDPGIKGDTGSMGPSGRTGNSGGKGMTGATGANGTPGIKGQKGDPA